MGRSSPSGRILALPGACIVDSGQPWLFTNGVFLNEPSGSPADLKALAEAALNHFQPSGHEWFLSASKVLHATQEGLGLYRRMGYRPVASYPLWEPAHP